jgi:anti-sigma regulatory factor (Ser/Thr protein kinase)
MSSSRHSRIGNRRSVRSDPTMGIQSFSVPARLQSIRHVSDAVAVASAEAGFDDKTSYACQLAVSEACENIVIHGYGQSQGESFDVEIISDPGSLTVELIDSAPAFDPTQVEVSPPQPPDDPPVGGLGLYIIHQVMDELTYQRSAGRNHLRLHKTLRKAKD